MACYAAGLGVVELDGCFGADLGLFDVEEAGGWGKRGFLLVFVWVIGGRGGRYLT